MYHPLGYSPGATKPPEVSNQRNGKGAKTVLTDDGTIRIEVPRNRDGCFQPLLIPEQERRFTGFDDKIVSIYVLGRRVRACLIVKKFFWNSDGFRQVSRFNKRVTVRPKC